MSTALIRLVSKLTKLEGRKSSVKVCDTRELLCVLKRLCKEDATVLRTLLAYLLK